MSDSGPRWRWLAVPLAALAVWGLARCGHPSTPDAPPRPASGASSSPPHSASSSPSAPERGAPYDPADFATQVRTHSRQAGINPTLLMAILYNESYKPHDPELERAWQRGKPEASFGIANMHRAAFDETKRAHGFADRRWEELPDDRDLAIEAAAWHLHDLAAQLPARWAGPYSRDELPALGYNAGAGNMSAFARGVKPGSQARTYLDRLHANWARAAAALRT
ncbi:transglycosylase SLT domain-containing protein [Streptomyces sp. NPDC048669]|uniref:transglycosylase SLT domain-containing protein n=1 Tax=Streptomyces sp. NPDC048669 TaxID=3155267 RepID=UPI0034265096